MVKNQPSLIESDLQHVWHPCSQMKDYEQFPPVHIKSAKGSYLYTHDGHKIIDAISSWWTKSLGHAHPKIQSALKNQLAQFEHVILANTTNEVIVSLSEKLAGLTKTLDKVFYTSDGACAVETAMKMSIHARQLLGQPKRRHFMALSNSYHGETCGALSVSDVGIYREPYTPLLLDVAFIQSIPYVTGKDDPRWHNCEAEWKQIEAQLAPHAETLTAIVVEPIVQGSGGMLIYSQDFLKRLRGWTQANNIHLIADEIMTGIGRTGYPLACQHAAIEPDFLCLSKGLTSGVLPLSVTLTSTAVYDLFYDDYEKHKSFLHSHTHSGNALAASCALATLEVMDDEQIYQQLEEKSKLMLALMQEVAEATNKLTNIRSLGAIVAADLITAKNESRWGFALYQKAMALGAFLRPLGNTLYWLPPLNITEDTLRELQEITINVLRS